MTLADEIIYGQLPNIQQHLAQGETLDDIDEYGFTPLIECAIVGNLPAAELLLAQGVDVDKTDVTGRTALHWAADNNNLSLVKMLLAKQSDPNAYNRGGQSVLVFPLLRDHWMVKQVLYQFGASLDFAMDFINAKLIGHRFELKGDVDIVNSAGEFIELDYEGFILEFSIDVIRDSLARFKNNYSARPLRAYFSQLGEIIYAFEQAAELLKCQYLRLDALELEKRITPLVDQAVLIFPVAYRGHAISFIKVGHFWAKIDRGENSQKEGTVNIYYMDEPNKCSESFIKGLLFQRQSEHYVHQQINQELGLKRMFTLPISQQITGNCSWANIEAIVPTALFMLQLENDNTLVKEVVETCLINAMEFYQKWMTWDKDRTIEACIHGFNEVDAQRQASRVSLLGAILFQACDFENERHRQRAQKIIQILMLPDFQYVLQSYIEAYCVQRLTPRGNKLLKFLEDEGINAAYGIQSIATAVKDNKNQS